MTFEYSPQRREGSSHTDIEGDSIPGRGLCTPGGSVQSVQGSARRPVALSGEGARERGVRVEVREVTGAEGGELWGAIGAFGANEWHTLV